MPSPFTVGICGGSGSGKTTLAKNLLSKFSNLRTAILFQDSYYFDQSSKFDGDGKSVNFDHPSAIDFQLMSDHLKQLKEGKSILVPIYDFKVHQRKNETTVMGPLDIILVDGILIFSQPSILSLLDFKIFLDVSEPIRYERRMRRDVVERGRTKEGVNEQLINHVFPMHNQFVEPHKGEANLVVSSSGNEIETAYQGILKSMALKNPLPR